MIQSEHGAQAIFNAGYKRDALFTVSNVNQDFMSFLNQKGGHTKTFHNFEQSFETQLFKLNVHWNSSKILVLLPALMMLAIASVYIRQTFSVHAAAAPESDDSTSNFENYLNKLYENVAHFGQNLDGLDLFPLRHARHKNGKYRRILNEQMPFNFLSSTHGWFRITASPFYWFHSRYLQQ